MSRKIFWIFIFRIPPNFYLYLIRTFRFDVILLSWLTVFRLYSLLSESWFFWLTGKNVDIDSLIFYENYYANIFFSRLRQYSRNILHVNMFFVFLLRSIIQLIIELWMSNGYFAHNVFERIDACNRTTVYFQEGDVSWKSISFTSSSLLDIFLFCGHVLAIRL